MLRSSGNLSMNILINYKRKKNTKKQKLVDQDGMQVFLKIKSRQIYITITQKMYEQTLR